MRPSYRAEYKQYITTTDGFGAGWLPWKPLPEATYSMRCAQGELRFYRFDGLRYSSSQTDSRMNHSLKVGATKGQLVSQLPDQSGGDAHMVLGQTRLACQIVRL